MMRQKEGFLAYLDLTLKYLASTKQIENKSLWKVINDLKDSHIDENHEEPHHNLDLK